MKKENIVSPMRKAVKAEFIVIHNVLGTGSVDNPLHDEFELWTLDGNFVARCSQKEQGDACHAIYRMLYPDLFKVID